MASLPPLAPSNTSSASSWSPANSGATSSASGNRSSASGGGDGGPDGRRKRRMPENISFLACTPCRHARQKCGGKTPNPCSRCLSKNLVCVYEPHTKTQKDDLIKEIEGLKSEKTDLQETAREKELQNRDLQQSSDWMTIILDTIGSNGHDREIIHRLRNGESHQTIADWLREQLPIASRLDIVPPADRSLISIVKDFETRYQGQSSPLQQSLPAIPTAWTKVSSSQSLLRHLFDLYFTWAHPVHMLFSEMDFKRDLISDDTVYCSSTLVNAICAMGCHFLENGEAEHNIQGSNADTLREGFMNQARSSLAPQSYKYMTSVQALAIMYLVEYSSGKARAAIGYLRSAIDFLEYASEDKQSLEAKELTGWGIIVLNTIWEGMTYQKLFGPGMPRNPIFQYVDMGKDATQWRFYHQMDDQGLPAEPAHALLTAFCQAELFRIINESLNVYCGLRGTITGPLVIDLYQRYREWQFRLPPELDQLSFDAKPLPHILSLHIQYHTAVVQHMCPLLHCDYFEGRDRDGILHLVIENAQMGLRLLELSRDLYSSRFSMPLTTFCTIHLCDALMRYSPQQPPAGQVVSFCLNLIQQPSPGFGIRGPAQELICRTAIELGLDLPEDVRSHVGTPAKYSIDDILDACTRLSYRPPLAQTTRQMDPAIAKTWSAEWEKRVHEPDSPTVTSGGRDMRINSLLNE